MKKAPILTGLILIASLITLWNTNHGVIAFFTAIFAGAFFVVACGLSIDKTGNHTVGVVIASLISATISIYAVYSTITRDAEHEAKKNAPPTAEQLENKRKGFHCLSGWNGAHYGVEQYVKKHLRDPDSYQHDETRISPVKDGEHTLLMTYRAKNGFGGYVPGVVVATVNNETCQAIIK